MVPVGGQAKVIEEIHQCHPGITRMKGLARSFVWWPSVDKQLEEKVRSCTSCQQNQNASLWPLYIPGNGLHDLGPDYT